MLSRTNAKKQQINNCTNKPNVGQVKDWQIFKQLITNIKRHTRNKKKTIDMSLHLSFLQRHAELSCDRLLFLGAIRCHFDHVDIRGRNPNTTELI